MGFRTYLPLSPDDLVRVLKAFGFAYKRTAGSHEQWEGVINDVRRISTVQRIKGEYSTDRMKRLIDNLGLTPEEFYRADSKIAKRYFDR